jgi:hypothetical protein
MQAFYEQLSSSTEQDTRLQALRRVAQATLAQITAIRGFLYWDVWGSENA